MSHDLTLKSHDFPPIQGDYSTGTGAPPPTTGGGGGGFWTGAFSASLTSVEFVMLSDDLSSFTTGAATGGLLGYLFGNGGL